MKFSKLLNTDSHDYVSTFLRLVLCIVMFPHGAQKMFGWFGGPGFAGTMGFMTQMGIPGIFAFLAIMAEFLGSLALFAGFLTRIAALGIAVNMIVAVSMVHWPIGFFMNWAGTQPGEGFEYHLLAIGIAVAIMVRGAGAWSVDARMQNRR